MNRVTLIPISMNQNSVKSQWYDLTMRIKLLWLHMHGIQYLGFAVIVAGGEFYSVEDGDSTEWD